MVAACFIFLVVTIEKDVDNLMATYARFIIDTIHRNTQREPEKTVKILLYSTLKLIAQVYGIQVHPITETISTSLN